MNHQSFTLKSFPGQAPGFPLEITGAVARRAQILALRLEIRGELASLALPEAAARPARRDGLWQETCLEFFLAPESFPQYWEFNLSPAGHWNIYGFRSYRQGMREEKAVAALPFTVTREPAALLFNLEVDVSGFLPPNQTLNAAIAAVIKARDGALTYWALTHPGPRPDFHRRDAFIITM
jgi:hypothetical protein